MHPNLRLAAWWLILVLLVLAGIQTTHYTLLFSRFEALLIDEFRNVIDYETGQWNMDDPNLRPLDFHKNWGVRHDVACTGIRLIALSSSALAAFLLGTLWWRGRGSRSFSGSSSACLSNTGRSDMRRILARVSSFLQTRKAAAWWWLALVLLVLACVLATSVAFRLHASKGMLLDDFRHAIDWETGKWQGVEGRSHTRGPLQFHKAWVVGHGVAAHGIRLMTLSWFALSLFLGVSLCWREWSNRRRRSGPDNAQYPGKEF